jgi:CO/xanthine dehydrogenase FAD-binding subunit
MVIAIAGLCLVIDEDRRRVSVALGSVGPTIIRATEAEQQLASAIESSHAWQDPSITLPAPVLDQFADLVASAAQPIDDVRGTAAYRRHGCRVLAHRAITWALDERRLPAWL